MAILTVEGIVKGGQIRLRDDVILPENAEVYVVIPDFEAVPRAHVRSPRLARPEQALDLVKQVVPVADDAKL
jgi:hypothetical protein